MGQGIFVFFNYIAEGMIAWQYANALFARKRLLWACILAFCGGYGAAWLLFRVHFIWLNILLFAAVNLVLLLVCFSCSWRSAVFHAVVLTGLMFSSEMLVEFVLGKIFGGFQQYQSNLMIFAALSVFSKLLFFGMSRLCIHIANRGKQSVYQSGPAVLFFSSFPTATVLVLLVMAYTALSVPLPSMAESLLAASSLVLLFANLLIFIGYQHDQKLNYENFKLLLAKQRDEAEANYLQELEEQYDQQRILIHDINRHLAVLQEMAEERSDKSVAEYVMNLMKTPALRKRVRYCADPLLNIVLSRYGALCKEKGIAFLADVRDIQVGFLSPEDVTSLFGNLLENAVEAAQGADGAMVELRVDSTLGATMVLSLVNSCKEAPSPDTDGGFVSRKTDKVRHGMGLKSIRSTVRKYSGTIQQRYDSDTRQFHTTIVIK